jgi:hypothetical protein
MSVDGHDGAPTAVGEASCRSIVEVASLTSSEVAGVPSDRRDVEAVRVDARFETDRLDGGAYLGE